MLTERITCHSAREITITTEETWGRGHIAEGKENRTVSFFVLRSDNFVLG